MIEARHSPLAEDASCIASMSTNKTYFNSIPYVAMEYRLAKGLQSDKSYPKQPTENFFF